MKKMSQNIKNKNILELICVFIVTLFLTISFYVVVQCSTDDAGSYLWLYSWNELGAVQHGLREILEPWFLVLIGLDFIGAGKTGAELVSYCFSVFYFLCVFITLKLCMKDNQNNRWLLMLAVFLLIPYSGTNRFHLFPAVVSLFVLYAISQYFSVKKKKWLVAAGLLFLYAFIFSTDRIISLLFSVIPIIVYITLVCLQDKKKHKFLYLGGFFVIAIVVGIKLINELCIQVVGQGLTLMETWGGYGGESYLTWIDIDNLFRKGIPSFFQALMRQYNIPVEGGLIQYNTFYWMIRIFIVGLALVALISRCREMSKKGVAHVNVLDALASITVIVLVCINVMNGMIKYYEIDSHPMNRYACPVWYLLVVILVRWLDEKYEKICLVSKKKYKITSGMILGVAFTLLTLGYSQPIYQGREALVKEPCQGEVDFLKENGDTYKYGIASFWKSYPITAMTNAEYVVSYGWIQEDEEDKDKLNLVCRGNKNFYRDGSNYFNYIISYSPNSMTVSEENIETIRGDYIEKERLYIDGKEESIIYLYDYDIRWEPKVMVECVGTDYELIDPIEYHYDLPLGTTRIDMEVANSENFLLEIADNELIRDVTIQIINDNRIYIDVTCLQETTVDFKVARKEDALTTIHKIVLKRVAASVTVTEGNNQVFFANGNYVMTFSGENIDKMQVEWNAPKAVIEQITDGELRRRYSIQIDEPQMIEYTISGKDVVIERISYEEGDLFEK